MKKRLIGMLLLVVMLIQLPLAGFAGSVVFLDADSDLPITELAQHNNVSARVKFTADKAGDVQIYTIGYDKNGAALKNALVNTINVEEGQEIDFTTASVSTDGLDNLKVLVWDKATLAPVLSKTGIISSVFSSFEGYDWKFNTEATEEAPLVVLTGNTIKAGDLFTAIEGAEINGEYFEISAVAADEGTASAQITLDADNWAESTITLDGAGLLELTAQDYSFCVPTKAYVKVVKSDDATLSALSIEGVEISPVFAADTYAYTATVPYETESATVAATANDMKATVAGTGSKDLVVGANTIEVVVTAEDGETTKTYVIVVTREAYIPSTDAVLSALSIEGVEISPVFAADTYAYTATVPYETESVTVVATTNDENATVTGTGSKDLVVGANTIEVTVTAEDGETTKTYTIVVTRAAYIPSTDATLSALSIEGVEISPVFAADTYAYTATVPHEIDKVTVAATVNDMKATVAGTGSKDLVVGANTIEVVVTAEDGETTKTYTIVVTREPATVEKFTTTTTAEAPKVVLTGKTIKAGDLFTAIDGADIKADSLEITATGTAQVTLNKDNWAESTITLNGEGVAEVTVQDYSYCLPTIAYVKAVAPVERYDTVFENTETYLYRVGNLNTVKLSQLFTVKEADLPIENVKVEPATVYGAATAEVEMKTNWGDSVVTFKGTGVVSLTISDDNSKPYTLKLEVVEAMNVTNAASATANSVVLLNNTSGSFSVTNGHTFYGNGFTVTISDASTVQNKGAGYTGYVSLGAAQDDGIATGGNLDNVRIIGPVYPEMYIYRNQAEITNSSDPDFGDGYNMRYFKNTVIVYGGDVTISNSYISGSRTALCLRAGNNVVLKNTTLSGGAYANVEIGGAIAVTLDDVTTVQTDVADSYGKGNTAHGVGIAVSSNVTDIYIKGELTQHNWINKTKWNSIVPSTYQSFFPKFFTNNTFSNCWHYLNGGNDPYVNLGMIFACDWDTSKIHDQRTEAVKTAVPYKLCEATMMNGDGVTITGGTYSKANTNGNAITDFDLSEPEYVSSGFQAIAPVLNFDNSPNHDAKDESNAADTYCVYTEKTKTLDIGITGESKTLDLSNVKVYHYGNEITREFYLNGTKLSGNSVTIKSADGVKQKLTIKAILQTDGFDANGNVISISQDYSFDITVNVATLSFAAPEWNMGGDYEFDATTNCVFVEYNTDFGEAVPIYEGIKVKYYNKSGVLTTLDLSGTKTIPTGSNNANANSFTYTLSDGSTLTMKYVSGWKSGATTHQFTTYNNKVYIYPQSIDNSNYARNEKTAQDFDVKISYTFTDSHGKSTNTQTMRWYNAKANNNNVTEVQWKTFDSDNGKTYSPPCVTGDTLVTMADGTQKRVDELTYDDEILVWDFYEGTYVAAPVSLIINHGKSECEIVTVKFDDGTELDIVNTHGMFNKTANEFVDVSVYNAQSFIGDTFMKATADGFKEVKLIACEVKTEYNSSYSPLSAKHYNVILNGMLTISPSLYCESLYEPFKVGEGMKYDAEQMQKDIETYGLYTYEDFSKYVTEEQFEAWGIATAKISVEKGYTTYDTIVEMLKVFALPYVK